MRPAGEPAPLDVRIDEKVYARAGQAPLVAIRGLAFSVRAGGFTCLIGPSGCGKTTALRIVMGLDTDYRGAITGASSGRLAAMFQEPRLLPWRTVEENVRLAVPTELGHADLAPLLEELDLGGMETRYPGELSLGLARRAALARAFAVRPDLLILDEPFASLDAATASRLRSLLIGLRRQTAGTVLMVTHDLREAITLADELVILAPRPTRVLGIEPIALDRPQRDTAAVSELCAAIEAKHPELFLA